MAVSLVLFLIVLCLSGKDPSFHSVVGGVCNWRLSAFNRENALTLLTVFLTAFR